MRLRNLLALAPLSLVVVACAAPAMPEEQQEEDQTSEGDPTEPAGKNDKKSTPPPAPGGQATTCPYTGPPLDVTPFPACGDGGRCVPDKAIPPDQQGRLAPCTGGFCVPEKILKAQGQYLPTSCKSFAGLEGRCTSRVFPDIEKQKDRLPQDACEANERCAPCFDPLGKETGACRSVTCDAPKEPFKAFAACCTSAGVSKGRCLPKSSMPPEAASGLEKKECPTSADLCVPEQELDEKFVHPKCTASSLLGSYEGVCISNCVAKDFLTELGTAKGNCSADSFCAPCKNPLTGASTGAPGCAP